MLGGPQLRYLMSRRFARRMQRPGGREKQAANSQACCRPAADIPQALQGTQARQETSRSAGRSIRRGQGGKSWHRGRGEAHMTLTFISRDKRGAWLLSRGGRLIRRQVVITSCHGNGGGGGNRGGFMFTLFSGVILMIFYTRRQGSWGQMAQCGLGGAHSILFQDPHGWALIFFIDFSGKKAIPNS